MPVTAAENYWVLESGESAYAFGIEPEGVLTHTHWGPRLPSRSDYPPAKRPGFIVIEDALQNLDQEVVSGEAGDSNERTVDAMSEATGLRGLALRFVTARPSKNAVSIELRDAEQACTVIVHYETLDNFGLFGRSLSIRNDGDTVIKLNRVFTGTLPLPRFGEFALTYLEGRWADEFRKQRTPIAYGAFMRESRRLTTSHNGIPFFAIDRDCHGLQATEETGEVWFGTLQWSGNWKLIAERRRDDRTIVHLGINDHDFGWDLQPGETFETPRLVFGHTHLGFGAMSRTYHKFIREELAPRRDHLPPVIYNSWMATMFDVNEDSQIELAKKAAQIGAEVFVVDDGWFAGRVGDDAGLGDWWPDPLKFPNGLKRLSSTVKNLGMKFGLWVEPEMVSPNSQHYRTHPDWIIHFPQRARTLSRNQHILNLGRPDVQEHLIAVLDGLLGSAAIDFIKWDMNRNVSEPGWPTHGRDQRELWVRYVRGLYRVWGELRRRHPHVVYENCSGGGGRVDLGMMALTEQAWTSDNTDASARLQIQDGYSLVFPANTMGSWVADEPFPADASGTSSGPGDAYSFDFRFHVSMSGALGIGGDLSTWDTQQCETAARHVSIYKVFRPLICYGDLYRLASPNEGPFSARSYVAKDKSAAVVFAYRTHRARIGKNPVLRLAGLDSDAAYSVDGGVPVSGRTLGWCGIEAPLQNFDSMIMQITRC